MEAHRVHAQRGGQVGRDLAQHLVDLDHLDRRAGRIEAQRLPQPVDHADVDARLEAAAEIDRQPVGLGVGTRRRDPLAWLHWALLGWLPRRAGGGAAQPGYFNQVSANARNALLLWRVPRIRGVAWPAARLPLMTTSAVFAGTNVDRIV